MEPVPSNGAPTRAAASCPRRPLVGLAFCFLGGTVAGAAWHVPATAALCLAAGALVVAAGCVRWARAAVAAAVLHGAVAVLALAAVRVRQEPVEKSLPALEGRRLELVGVVTGEPEWFRARTRMPRTVRFPLRVESGMPSATAAPATVMVRLVPPDDPAWRRPFYGDRWRCTGTFEALGASGLAPVRYRFACAPGDAIRLSDGHGIPAVRWIYRARQRAATLLSVGIRDFPESVGLLQSMLLGYRERLSWRIQDFFVETGTLHIFAISGAHVMILAYLVTFALNAMRVSREYWFFFLLPLLVGYTIAVGAMASAVRACVMSVACAAAPLLGRKADYASALALAAVAIVMVSPDQLFDLGFILSFGVVAGLLVFTPSLQAPLERLGRPDPLRVVPEGRWTRLARAGWQNLVSLLAMSTAAWLASAPLMLYAFGRLTPVALVSNLVIVPLSSLVVLTGCLSISFGACWTALADVANHANLALVWVLIQVARWMAKIPGGNVEVGSVSLGVVVFSYVLLACVAVKAHRRTVDIPVGE